MEVLICHNCGAIARARGKFCTGCGSHVTVNTATGLPVMTMPSQPLVATINPDPLLLEMMILRHDWADAQTNVDNGHDDDSQLNFEPLMPPAPLPPPIAPPPTPLGNVLGSANPNVSAAGAQPRLSAAEMLSLMQEDKPPPPPEPVADPMPAQDFSLAPQPTQPGAGNGQEQPLSPEAPISVAMAHALAEETTAAMTQSPFNFNETPASAQQAVAADNFAPPMPADTANNQPLSATEAASALANSQAAVSAPPTPSAAETFTPVPAPLSIPATQHSAAPTFATQGTASAANTAPASLPPIPGQETVSEPDPAPITTAIPAAQAAAPSAISPAEAFAAQFGESAPAPQAKADDFFSAVPIAQAPANSQTQSNNLSPASQPTNATNSQSESASPPTQAAATADFNFAPVGQSAPAKAAPAKASTQDLDFFAAAPMPQPKAESETPRSEASQKLLEDPDFFPNATSSPSAASYVPPPSPAPSPAFRDKEAASTESTTEPKKATHEDIGILARRARNRHTEYDTAHPTADNPIDKIKNALTGEIQIGGKPFPKLAIAVGAFVILMIAFSAFGLVTSAIGGFFGDIAGKQSASGLPSLSGQYKFGFLIDDNVHRGQLVLEQRGNDIFGNGKDDAYFEFRGKFNPPQLQFSKQYVINGQTVGKPVLWTGKVDFPSGGGAHIMGTYSATFAHGVFRFRRVETKTGKWEARMTQMIASGASNNTGPTGNAPELGEATKTADEKIKDTQGFFLKIAIGIIIGCVLLAMGSLKLFGPSGLINIWAKKEYIPSQFKSQHNKMLGEMGKGNKPGGLPLGTRVDWGLHQFHKPQRLALTPELREQNPHILVVGAGSKGKSRLLANMITSDIKSNDRSVVVIDSTGALVDLLVDWVAQQPDAAELAKRVILMDPTHKGFCPAYNPLEMHSDNDDLQEAASSIVHGFKAIYTEPPGSQSQWNQQTANILRSATLLLMVNGRTLTDLPNLLSDNDFRDIMLEKVERQKNDRTEYITLLETWGQYKRLARTDQWITWVEPILNRVTPMLSDPRIRPILTKPKGELNLREIMSERKILLVKIPNANLLGSLIVTGLKQTGKALDSNNSKHPPCALYLDEFDNLLEKETISSITTDTKKIKIGLTAVTRSLQQLPEDFRNQLIIQVGTMCVFSLAKKDADMLGPQMFRVDGRKIKHQTIQNLFNKVNSTPQFELISDEEKLNIDRVVGQEERTFFCYRVGTVAGVFHLKVPEFKDIPENQINWTVVEQMYGNNDGSNASR